MTEPANKKASPYPLRLDESLKQWTEERAKRNGRSMNSEIIQILKEAKAREAEPPAMSQALNQLSQRRNNT